MTQVNAVNIKKIPQLTEVLELPSNADIPIYDPATGVTGRIKAALLKGGEEIKTNWASTTTYAIDAVVEFQLKLWKSLINNNTGNTPVEGSNWTEVSKSRGNGYGYWNEGVFTQDPSMVIRSGGLFLLDNTKVTFPFNSTDFETEYNAGIWVQPTGNEAGVITTDTTNFNKNLTSAENTVQKALDKIDDLDIPQTTTIDIDTLEPYDPLLTYDAGVYKSYVNLESSDKQFHDPAIYLSMFPVGVGQTPESHPYDPDTNTGFWWYLGYDPVEVTSRATAKTTVFSEGELRAIEGAKSGDTCNILDSYLNIEIIYKFDINSTAAEIPYQVVKPLDGNGRWLSQGIKNLQPSFESYSLPYAAGFNYGLSPNKIHYYKAVDLRPNAQLFVTSTFATTSSLYRSEEYAIFIDNSINTVDLAIILNIDASLIEWVDGVSTSVIKAGKKVYLTAKWMFVSAGVYKLLIRVDPVNEEVSGGVTPPVINAFTNTLLFDNDKYYEYDMQSGDLSFVVSSTGNVNNKEIVFRLIGDGIHKVAFSGLGWDFAGIYGINNNTVIPIGNYMIYFRHTSWGGQVVFPTDYGVIDNLPTVLNIVLGGTPLVGYSISATYTYNDLDGDIESGTTFQWYRSDNISGLNEIAISGATALSYLLVSADEGKYLRIRIIPANNRATGFYYYSAYSAVIQGEFSADNVALMALEIDPHNSSFRTLSGSNILTLTDQSTNAKVFSLPSGNTSPELLTANLNGRDVADFDGVSDGLGTDGTWHWPTNAEMFIIVNVLSNQNDVQSPLFWKASEFQIQYGGDPITTVGFGYTVTLTATPRTDQWACVYIKKVGTSIRMVDSSAKTGSLTITPNVNPLYIFRGTIAGYETIGKLALIRCYNRELTSDERTIVVSTLQTRYGITINV